MDAKHYELKQVSPDELRPCGDCQACCSTMAVVEIEKDNYTGCQHQCSTGCAIYDKRPASCQSFNCWYRAGLVKQRPDKLGVIVDYNPVINTIYLWEVRPGASETKKVKSLMAHLRKTYNARLQVVTKENAAPLSTTKTEEYKLYESAAMEFAEELAAELQAL